MTENRPRVRADIALRSGYHSPQIDVEVRLNTNEAPTAPPAGFDAALHDAIDRIAWHRYPERAAKELRAKIGVRYDRAAAEVFVANGSNEVLQTIMLTFGGAGRSAAVFEPTYALHSHISKTTGTEVVEGRRRDDFRLDLDEVRRVITEHSPDVVFLCSPNNPTGLVDPADTVTAVLDMLMGENALLVVDEAYGQFATTSAVDLVAEDVPLVVSRTFSKTWSMAAARLGYLIGPAWLVAELEKVVLPYHLDAFKQAAGIAALDFGDEMDARVARLVEERGRLMERMAELPVEIWESGANFFLIRAHDTAGDDLWQALVDRSILVRNCASWPGLDGCLRITVGTPDENDRLTDALAEILAR
ncbi:MAG: histidinol-phosphate transaminase [Acidimicrobiales bacterium]